MLLCAALSINLHLDVMLVPVINQNYGFVGLFCPIQYYATDDFSAAVVVDCDVIKGLVVAIVYLE